MTQDLGDQSVGNIMALSGRVRPATRGQAHSLYANEGAKELSRVPD